MIVRLLVETSAAAVYVAEEPNSAPDGNCELHDCTNTIPPLAIMLPQVYAVISGACLREKKRYLEKCIFKCQV